MKQNEYPDYTLPIKKEDRPPPFRELIISLINQRVSDLFSSKKNNFYYDLDQVLKQIEEHWYSKGISDRDKMNQD